jgi:sporulation protein YlmC with PRC-barrel domain
MNRRTFQVVTAAALAALAGQAVGQQQQQQYERMTASEARQLSQKLQEANKSLTDAIQLAERETGGKALAAEIMRSSDLDRMYREGEGAGEEIRRPGDPAERERDRQRERDPQLDREQDRQRDMERQREQDRDEAERNRERLTGGQMQRGLHASVVCLVNDTQLRRVIVDLEEGRVVQSRALGAGWDRGDRDMGDRSAGDGSQMWLASTIINANVVNPAGDDLGDIDDLALDVTSGRVRYAVLRTGGFLGMGGDRHAAPLHALTFIGEDEVRINISKEELEDRPGFDNDRWPQHPTAEWGAGRQAPGQQPDAEQQREGQQPQVQRPGQQDRQEMSSTVEKASDVIGATVHGAGDASVGDVDDIVIKPQDSSIAHYVVATDDGKVAVPASKITMQNRRLTLSMEQSEFDRLPRFRDNENPDWTNPQWLRDLGDDEREPVRRDREPDRRGG